MFRTGLAAGLVVAAVAGTPAHAAYETTTVAYSSNVAAYISATYRESVDGLVDQATGIVGTVTTTTVNAATKADCSFEAVGSDLTGGIQAVFVAHVVVTSLQNRSGRPVDSVPAATGIVCSIRNGTDLVEWESVKPGNSAYDVRTQTLPYAANLEICTHAWVIYGDGSRVDYPPVCKSS